MKWLLLIVLGYVLFRGGPRQLHGLFDALKRLPKAFRDGKAAEADPVSVAREVQPLKPPEHR